MTKPTKIALSASRDIPFNQLVLSQSNVRRVKAGVSIDALAADIARRGLLQSLTVRAERDESGGETGKFEVPAGGRRFRALQQLVKEKRLSRTAAVPCIVRDDDEISAEEDSLAENTHRETLHPLDQFRAMQQLAGQGSDVETIAATFMTTPAVVRQRLRLASVSPRLHDVYAVDGMTLEQLIAFSVSENHARQEQVWDLLQSSHNKQPWMIRHKLTEETVRASDKRARFVGLDAYQTAGGYVLRDLFEADDGGWLQDIALLDQLVDAKLKAEAERVAGEGWKWIATAVEFPYDADAGMRILEGEQPPLTDEQESRLEALRREAEALEGEWSGKPDIPDEIDARVTAIDEEIAAILERPLAYDPDEVARAGVFISIDRLGGIDVERGYVRPEDEPGLEIIDDEVPDPDALQERPDADEDSMGSGEAIAAPDAGDEEEEQEDPGKPLPDRLVTELTTWRTLALRNAVALSPAVAFAAVLHALVLDAFYRYAGGESCVEISVRGGSLGTHAPGLGDSPSAQAIEQRSQAWADRLPDDPDQLWETLAGFSADEQAALFAHCAASGINAVWEPANRYSDGRVSARTVAGRLAHSHVLARAAGLDPVVAGWSATVDNYLGRVTKARILSAVEEAKGSEVSARIAALKKPDMAREAESLLDGSGWLAEPLRTPVPVEPDTPPAAPVANDDPAPLGTDRAEADADAESFAIAAE
jgi:ParB family chromosome partitioning protein